MGRVGKMLKRKSLVAQDQWSDLMAQVEETLGGLRIIKAFNAEQKMTNKFDEYNQVLKQSGWKAQFLSGLMQPLMSFVGNLGFVGVCLVLCGNFVVVLLGHRLITRALR